MARYQTLDIPPDHRDDLTDEIKQAIKSWTKDSIPINTALRYGKDHECFKGKPEVYKKAILEAGLLSEAINESTLNQEYAVTRGLGPYDVNRIKAALEERNETRISPLITDKGFTAVSFVNRVALGYAEPDKNGEKYLITSWLNKGDTALFIGNESSLSSRKEGEILLMMGSNYYISGERIYTSENGTVVHLIDVVFVKR